MTGWAQVQRPQCAGLAGALPPGRLVCRPLVAAAGPAHSVEDGGSVLRGKASASPDMRQPRSSWATIRTRGCDPARLSFLDGESLQSAPLVCLLAVGRPLPFAAPREGLRSRLPGPSGQSAGEPLHMGSRSCIVPKQGLPALAAGHFTGRMNSCGGLHSRR